MMELKYLKLDKQGPVTILTLNSPSTRNSLSEEMGVEFQETINQCCSDRSTRALILTGDGVSFSSGGDFKLLEKNMDNSFQENKEIMEKFYSYYLSITKLGVPTIASINGAAIGAGLCLALACDIRITIPTAKMGMTFIKLGLHPGMGATYFLPRLIGQSRALELFITGRIITGEEAYQLGLVNYLVEKNSLEKETMNLAMSIAMNPRLPVEQVKKVVLEGSDWVLSTILQYEAESQARCYATDDFREGLNAVKNKIKPKNR